jgi:hypothetical protein
MLSASVFAMRRTSTVCVPETMYLLVTKPTPGHGGVELLQLAVAANGARLNDIATPNGLPKITTSLMVTEPALLPIE